MLHSRDFQGHRASVIFRTSAVQSRRTLSYPFSAIAERTEAAASAVDSGIYRYPPFSIFSFIACLTASGVIPASRTVSTVWERRVSTPSALIFAAACGTVGLSTGIVVDVSDVLAGACTLADELPVGLFLSYKPRQYMLCALMCLERLPQHNKFR